MLFQITNRYFNPAATEMIEIMTIHDGYWWIHVDGSEGFRMARVHSVWGDMFARSASPSLIGPYDASVRREDLLKELDRVFYVENNRPRPKLGRKSGDGLNNQVLRELISKELDSREMTVWDMTAAFGIQPQKCHDVLKPLIRSGIIVKGKVAANCRDGRLHYWKKAA
jgi:hypothetical protein